MAHDNYPVVVIDGDGENSSDEANGDNGYFEFCHILNVIQDTYWCDQGKYKLFAGFIGNGMTISTRPTRPEFNDVQNSVRCDGPPCEKAMPIDRARYPEIESKFYRGQYR